MPIQRQYQKCQTIIGADIKHVQTNYDIQFDDKVPKLGVLLVGLGGNNGSTMAASLIANKLKLQWQMREGVVQANWLGSMLMSSCAKIGVSPVDQQPIYKSLHSITTMVDPNDIVLSGWDICGDDLAVAMDKAKVLEPALKSQLATEMAILKPMPSIYREDFIAPNQKDRANNCIVGDNAHCVKTIRNDILTFKKRHQLDKVIVLWTATTERFCDVRIGLNDNADNLLNALAKNDAEISPSTMFAIACIQERVVFINGSPQNTHVPGLIEYAYQEAAKASDGVVCLAGDDFKSGQTKLKACLADMLMSAGIKPLSVTSYNHLGNNDGRNLSNPPQFRSKEISKSEVVELMCRKNPVLFPAGHNLPDHTVVIKYVPAVGDSKRAMDQYYSDIHMGGKHTMAIHNTCEDSLLAVPIMLDLVLMAELLSRVRVKGPNDQSYRQGSPVLSMLAYWLKSPLGPPAAGDCGGQQYVDQELSEQRKAIESFLLLLGGYKQNVQGCSLIDLLFE